MTSAMIRMRTQAFRVDAIHKMHAALQSLNTVAKIPARTRVRVALLRDELDRRAGAMAIAYGRLIEEHREVDAGGVPVPVPRYDILTGVVILKRDANGEPIPKRTPDGNLIEDARGRLEYEPMIDDQQIKLRNPVAFTAALAEHNATEIELSVPIFGNDEIETLAENDAVTADQLGILCRFTVPGDE